MTFSQKTEEIKQQEVFNAVMEQITEELGPEDTGKKYEQAKKMLSQKYGVTPPQLTGSEKNLIMREERLKLR